MIIWNDYEKGYEPYKEVIVPKGKENENVEAELQKLCKMSSEVVREIMMKTLKKCGYRIYTGKYFIWGTPKEVKKESSIILTAHYDTVQDKNGAGKIYVNKEKNKTYLWGEKGIGGDDRCGIGIIKELVERNYKPTILLCDKEESGGQGSKEFIEKYDSIKNKEKEYSYILELDRKGKNELVFYEEENKKFIKAMENITKGNKKEGTFSDICNLYSLKIASVNLSVGYYKQHTKSEYIIAEEYRDSLERVAKIITTMFKKYKHQEKIRKLYDKKYYKNPYSSYGYDEYFNSFDENKKLTEYEIGTVDGDYVIVKGEDKIDAISTAQLDYGLCKEEITYAININTGEIEWYNKDAIYEPETK